jgi:hypothetical protein
MAYKSIKKGKGKRKGGKSSNRRTYKQNGGNKMLLMLIAMLVSLGLIVPVSAKFYNKVVNKEDNENKIKFFTSKLIEFQEELSNINRLDTKLLATAAAAIIPNPAQAFAVGNLVGNVYKSQAMNANIAHTRKKIDILKAEIDEDYLFLTRDELMDLLPFGIRKDFAASPDFKPGTTKVNTGPYSLFYTQDYVRAPITEAYIGLPDVYAVNINGWLNMIKNNMQLANFAMTTIVNEANNSGSVIDNGPTIEEIDGGSKL